MQSIGPDRTVLSAFPAGRRETSRKEMDGMKSGRFGSSNHWLAVVMLFVIVCAARSISSVSAQEGSLPRQESVTAKVNAGGIGRYVTDRWGVVAATIRNASDK